MVYMVIYQMQCERIFENKNGCAAALILLLDIHRYENSRANYHRSSVRMKVGLAG